MTFTGAVSTPCSHGQRVNIRLLVLAVGTNYGRRRVFTGGEGGQSDESGSKKEELHGGVV